MLLYRKPQIYYFFLICTLGASCSVVLVNARFPQQDSSALGKKKSEKTPVGVSQRCKDKPGRWRRCRGAAVQQVKPAQGKLDLFIHLLEVSFVDVNITCRKSGFSWIVLDKGSHRVCDRCCAALASHEAKPEHFHPPGPRPAHMLRTDMVRTWDAGTVSPSAWRERRQILKPGQVTPHIKELNKMHPAGYRAQICYIPNYWRNKAHPRRGFDYPTPPL